MFNFIKEGIHFMSEFLDNLEAKIKDIHIGGGVDNATVIAESVQAANDAVAPVVARVNDLEKVLTDVINHLAAGNTDAATAAATAAVVVPEATDTVAGDTGADTVTGGDTVEGATA